MSIDKYVAEKNIFGALQECINTEQYYIGLFLGNLLSKDEKCQELLRELETRSKGDFSNFIKVKLLCNWCTSEQLAKTWNKMSKGNYTWNKIKVVWSEKPDYYVIINRPPENEEYDKKKSIVFQMEPYMSRRVDLWKEWANPDKKDFLYVCKHADEEYNNNEWHLSRNYTNLWRDEIVKNPEYDGVISTILSAQYKDIGHVKRIDFVKFLEEKLAVHVYGNNRWDYKEYKGALPYHCKDDGIFPYKYTFNAENNSIPYYYTEKLIDGILGECLTFYWGCPNIRELIDPRAYVQLELSNFEKDFQIIQTAIKEDWHKERLPYIREAKRKILTELQFFPRLESIIKKIQI